MRRKRTKRTRRKRRRLKGGAPGDHKNAPFSKKRTPKEARELEESFDEKYGKGSYKELKKNPLDFWKKKQRKKWKKVRGRQGKKMNLKH